MQKVTLTLLAAMTLAAWALATNRLVLTEEPSHNELVQVDCRQADDVVSCLADRAAYTGRF